MDNKNMHKYLKYKQKYINYKNNMHYGAGCKNKNTVNEKSSIKVNEKSLIKEVYKYIGLHLEDILEMYRDKIYINNSNRGRSNDNQDTRDAKQVYVENLQKRIEEIRTNSNSIYDVYECAHRNNLLVVWECIYIQITKCEFINKKLKRCKCQYLGMK